MGEHSAEIERVPAKRSHALKVFDEHHPPSSELIADCVHCGFCLPTCPTYRLWGQEADSPRGRIYLMKLGLAGEVAMDEAFVEHFDRCLGCMACLTSCPSGVQYDSLIEATRAQIERRYPRSAWEKFLRGAIFAVFPYPARLRVLAVPLWIYQKSGLEKLVRGSGILKFLPARVRMMEGLAPRVKFGGSVGTHRRHGYASTRTRGTRRVGLLLGCVQRVFFGDVNGATARVLAAEGCEVVVPAGQGCCGALCTHAGEEAQAVDFARRMIDCFEAADVDVIAINAAGCGSAMKEYGRLLRDDPAYARRAEVLAGKCRDISEVLAEIKLVAIRHPLPFRIAYHDACHLQHAQRITFEPRELLRQIPGLELLEIENPAICCGSAGIYNLLQPEAAKELGEQKARAILSTGAQAVVSGNPGCTLQLQNSLAAMGQPLPVLHWVELLDASISGTIPAAFAPTSQQSLRAAQEEFVMWTQNYTPVGGSLGLSAAVAAIPILVLFVMLGVLRKPTWMAALAALAVAFVLALVAYRMPVSLAVMATVSGAAYGIFPIAWVVFAAIMLYRLAVETGKFEIIKDSIGGLTSDRRLQALFIAFSFGAFIEGAAGFGAPVAVCGAMLAGLGFSPFYAAGICLLANTAPVAFGSIGIPLITLAQVTGIPAMPLSAMVGRMCAMISLVIPMYLLLVMVGWRKTLEVIPAVIVCGLSFAVVQFYVSNFVGPALTDILSSLSCITCTALVLKFWKPKSIYRFKSDLPAAMPAGVLILAGAFRLQKELLQDRPNAWEQRPLKPWRASRPRASRIAIRDGRFLSHGLRTFCWSCSCWPGGTPPSS